DVLKPGPHRAFTLRIAGTMDVCRIAQQEQDAPLAVIGERVEIEQLVVRRRRIYLEVAGVDDHTQRSGDGQSDRANNGMRHAEKFDLEWPQFDLLPCLDHVQPRLLQQVVFFQAALDQRKGKRRAVDRNIQLRQKEWNTADVV